MQTMFCGGVTLRWEDCDTRVARISGDKVESRRFFMDTEMYKIIRAMRHAPSLPFRRHQLFLLYRGDALKVRLKCQSTLSTCT